MQYIYAVCLQYDLIRAKIEFHPFIRKERYPLIQYILPHTESLLHFGLGRSPDPVLLTLIHFDLRYYSTQYLPEGLLFNCDYVTEIDIKSNIFSSVEGP